MEAEATPPAKTLRKLKGFENAASSNFKHQNPFMKPLQIYQLIGRQNNHFSIIKGLILLSIIVVLFLNIISYLFNYPFLPHPILIISSFSSSNSSMYNSNSYSHNLNSSNISSSNPPTFLNSSTTLNSPPPPPLAVNFNSLPPPPLEVNLSPPSSNFGNSINRKLIKDCDLSKGEWVRDWKAPYYTNITCYTIQEHQNCMKYGKPNLDFLKWRWKPDGCELPLFEPKQFLEIMRGKTLAFVGDSLARNQMQSLMCLLSRVMYPKDISENSDDNFKRMYYPAFNFTITMFWSPFLIKAKETKGPKNTYLGNLYLDQVDNKWASHINEFDHLIISAGRWFERPSIFYHRERIVGCLYCTNKNVTQRTMHYSNTRAFQTSFQAINNSKKFKGTVILRTVSPAHFENGVWNNGGDCARTRPFLRNETNLSGDEKQLYKDQIKEFEKAKSEGMKKGTEFQLLDMTNAMLLRPDGHPSRYGHWPDERWKLNNDCVHWCLPGPVDMWNDMLVQMLSV